jgi:AcrR family transcriptional regulator
MIFNILFIVKKKGMREDWLEQGYIDFAEYGPDQLSINRIGKVIGASRSSFYHHFGDVDLFIDELLQYHWSIAVEFNTKGKEYCKQLIPDLYDALAQYPVPLKFSIQLFHNRHIPRFNYLFNKTYESSAEGFLLPLFADHLGVETSPSELKNLWITLGEAWYSRLDPKDLSAKTMAELSESMLRDMKVLMDSKIFSTLERVY